MDAHLAYSRGRGRGPNASIARIWAHRTASTRHHAVSLIVVALCGDHSHWLEEGRNRCQPLLGGKSKSAGLVCPFKVCNGELIYPYGITVTIRTNPFIET